MNIDPAKLPPPLTRFLSALPEGFIQAIAARHGFSEADIMGRVRKMPLAETRQLIMYLLVEGLGCAPNVVARRMQRDHGTISHAITHIAGLMEAEPGFKEQVEAWVEWAKNFRA